MFACLLISFLFFVQFNSNSNSIDAAADNDGRGADARSTEVSVGCLASDTRVQLITGEQIFISQLKSSNQIRTIENDEIRFTEMILMMDQNPHQIVKFYRLKTSSGHEISLTSLHLIPTRRENRSIRYESARNVRLFDELFVSNGTTIETSPIVQIEIHWQKGFFAPLTTEGTFLGNNILLSCYSIVTDHHLAHRWLKPVRYYYYFRQRLSTYLSLSSGKIESRSNDGMHFWMNFLYQSASWIYPSAFQI